MAYLSNAHVPTGDGNSVVRRVEKLVRSELVAWID
jgi:hypothetical protein